VRESSRSGDGTSNGLVPDMKGVIIVPWEDLTEEQQREWVQYLARLMMSGGETLYDMARKLRLEMADRLEIKS
jgi:uncharacterized protein YoaH (UPF0181 family)